MELSLVRLGIHTERAKSSRHCIALLDSRGIESSALAAKSSCAETQPWSSGCGCRLKEWHFGAVE